MGFFENIGVDHSFSRELAKIVVSLSSDHHIESDLDLYVNAVDSINNNSDWNIVGEVNLNMPFLVDTPVGLIRVALFNELHHNVSFPIFESIINQYQATITSYLKESQKLMDSKQISIEGKQMTGYFAATITEARLSESLAYYPKEKSFQYYFFAEPAGRSFRRRSFRIEVGTIN